MALGVRFWRFWTATVLANLGDGIGMAAFPLQAASITGDPFAVAVVAAATGIPWPSLASSPARWRTVTTLGPC